MQNIAINLILGIELNTPIVQFHWLSITPDSATPLNHRSISYLAKLGPKIKVEIEGGQCFLR